MDERQEREKKKERGGGRRERRKRRGGLRRRKEEINVLLTCWLLALHSQLSPVLGQAEAKSL